MERLTKRVNGEVVFQSCYGTCETCEGVICRCIPPMVERLADYEDTGREPKEITALDYTLQGVMHAVDKWLGGAELKQDEVNRAATMREKTLRIVEDLQAEVDRLRKRVQTLEDGGAMCLDEQMALAMCAGARAIENSKRLFGMKYVYGVFGEHKILPYSEAAKMLREKAEPVLNEEGEE